MSRKVLFQLVLPLIGLSILFWLLAFAPGERKNQPALLEMSVILRDGDGAVSTMRRGMEQAACNGVPTGGTVLLLDSLPGDNGIRERMLAARETLERAGRQVRIYQWSADTASFTDILRIERPGAVVAFEVAVLAEAAEMARSNESFPLLYGCGSTPAIAAALEEGRVTAIAALNVFSAGYLAVDAAAALARHEDWTGVPTVAFSIVRQENMYDNDNQKLLFPVT